MSVVGAPDHVRPGHIRGLAVGRGEQPDLDAVVQIHLAPGFPPHGVGAGDLGFVIDPLAGEPLDAGPVVVVNAQI